ncbi:MAG: NAD(P)H-dependent glycerol-3-phosphate dehydrogenase [Fibrobacteres bacterium]|nr:NAD(P)H-dependent glycerol-3-phosphate dehydrogenase [Fibrobacterota bacterium]
MKRLTVLGAGSWGITLAIILHDNGHKVTLWEFDPLVADMLRTAREEKRKLPGVFLPAEITVSNDFKTAVTDSELVVCAIPTQFIRRAVKPYAEILKNKYVVNVSKGIETGTFSRISTMLKEEAGVASDHYAILSGPSHAEEVSKKIPTTVVAASTNSELALLVQQLFSTKYFRIYTNDDVVGVELAGALKNVIAIAAGVADGLGFGDNTKGALLTRGMVEMTRLGVALGAKRDTFGGLAGMGDLITTCMSRHSRNRYVGEEIGKGRTLDEILKGMSMVAEGVETCRSAKGLSGTAAVEMPITDRMYAVLFNGENPLVSVKSLMEREPKPEVI